MTQCLTSSQVYEFDRMAAEEFGMQTLELMESAGSGVADCLMRLNADRAPVVVCCGKGNNAGDGFVVARHVHRAGFAVTVVATADRETYRADAAVNLKRAEELGVKIEYLDEAGECAILCELPQPAWGVDALLGVGAAGAPRAPMDNIIRRLNAAPIKRLAIDLPSGLEADTGEPSEPTFRADVTCTLVAPKPGLLEARAKPYVGELKVVGLGVPDELLRRFELLESL